MAYSRNTGRPQNALFHRPLLPFLILPLFHITDRMHLENKLPGRGRKVIAMKKQGQLDAGCAAPVRAMPAWSKLTGTNNEEGRICNER
jgi:hypothetical protein